MSLASVLGTYDTFRCPNGHTVELDEKTDDEPRGSPLCCRRSFRCPDCGADGRFTISAGGDKTLTDGWKIA